MREIPWTMSQRRALIVLCVALSIYIGIRYLTHRRHVPDPQPITPELAGDLQDKIDPNQADAATLAVLPLIGEKRAADIVAFREQFRREHPQNIPFKDLHDLARVRGIGPSTLMQMKPFLIFPATRPSTTPSVAPEETPRD